MSTQNRNDTILRMVFFICFVSLLDTKYGGGQPPSPIPPPAISQVIEKLNISKKLQLDLEKHNKQYAPIEAKEFHDAHDCFLILDETEVYHIGASLKDLGQKWFAFSKLERNSILEIFKRLKTKYNETYNVP